VVKEKVYLITVYVDDLLIFALRDEIDRLGREFTNEFRWITLEIGNSHSYLGMQLFFDNGQVTVDISYYLRKILMDIKDLKEEVLPAKKNLFASDLESPLLDDGEKQLFHTVVAKLLYLSRRARPDIITTIGFLCTRVQAPTEEDRVKLRWLLGYLLKTKDDVLVLKPSECFKVVAYIDASFAIHNDGKSHTGVVIFVGGVAVYCASRKQKCVSKSSTEAELIALSDNIG
jgi:hypothetical protein